MPKNDRIMAFSLRLPDELLQQIAEIANDEQRSTNGEIVKALREHVAAVFARKLKASA